MESNSLYDFIEIKNNIKLVYNKRDFDYFFSELRSNHDILLSEYDFDGSDNIICLTDSIKNLCGKNYYILYHLFIIILGRYSRILTKEEDVNPIDMNDVNTLTSFTKEDYKKEFIHIMNILCSKITIDKGKYLEEIFFWDLNEEVIKSILEDEKDELNIKENDSVNHPSYYAKGKIECIDAIEEATKNKKGIVAVCIGIAIKYLWRSGNKKPDENSAQTEKDKEIQDLQKSVWYINHAIEYLKKLKDV